jgi:hypothetical protein
LLKKCVNYLMDRILFKEGIEFGEDQ